MRINIGGAIVLVDHAKHGYVEYKVEHKTVSCNDCCLLTNGMCRIQNISGSLPNITMCKQYNTYYRDKSGCHAGLMNLQDDIFDIINVSKAHT